MNEIYILGFFVLLITGILLGMIIQKLMCRSIRERKERYTNNNLTNLTNFNNNLMYAETTKSPEDQAFEKKFWDLFWKWSFTPDGSAKNALLEQMIILYFCYVAQKEIEALSIPTTIPPDAQGISTTGLVFIMNFNPGTGQLSLFINGFEDTTVKTGPDKSVTTFPDIILSGADTGGRLPNLPGEIPKYKPCSPGLRDDGADCWADQYDRGVGTEGVYCPPQCPHNVAGQCWGHNYYSWGAANCNGPMNDPVCDAYGCGYCCGGYKDCYDIEKIYQSADCPPDKEKGDEFGLCYPHCRDGYHGFVTECIPNGNDCFGNPCIGGCAKECAMQRQYCEDGKAMILALCYSPSVNPQSVTPPYFNNSIVYDSDQVVKNLGHASIISFPVDIDSLNIHAKLYLQVPPINILIDKITDYSINNCFNFSSPFTFNLNPLPPDSFPGFTAYNLNVKTGNISTSIKDVFLKLQPIWFNIKFDININGSLDINIPIVINPPTVPPYSALLLNINESGIILQIYAMLGSGSFDGSSSTGVPEGPQPTLDLSFLKDFISQAAASISLVLAPVTLFLNVIPIIGTVLFVIVEGICGTLVATAAAVQLLPDSLFIIHKGDKSDPLSYFITTLLVQNIQNGNITLSLDNIRENPLFIYNIVSGSYGWTTDGIMATIIRNATSKMKEFSVNLIKFIGPMILGAAGIKRTGGLFPYNVSDGSQYKPPM